MTYDDLPSGIKSWAEDDRPREKMLLKGKAALSDAELLAILIGMGTTEHSAVDLGKIILKSIDNDLHKLGKLNIADLTKFKGIGPAKAITIISAMELARRRKEFEAPHRYFIKDSGSVYTYLKTYLSDLHHEEFWILCLSRRLEVIRAIQISSGGTAGTIVDPKIVFTHALENKCSTIILSHNHPSGSLKPSQEDVKLTQKLKQAGQILDIKVVEHLIFTDNGYFSFADEGMI